MRNEGYGNGRVYSSTGIAVGKGNENGHGIGFGKADDPEGTAWVPHGYSLGGFTEADGNWRIIALLKGDFTSNISPRKHRGSLDL